MRDQDDDMTTRNGSAEPQLGATAYRAGVLETDPPRVVELETASDGRWSAFVQSHPDGLVYHHPAWAKAIARACRYPFVGLASEDANGQLTGVLPLFEKRGVITGHRLSSLPHTPVAGPLAANDAAALALGRAAIAHARARSLALELKLPSEELGRLLPAAGLVPCDAAYVVELPERADDLRFGDPRNHRRIKWAVGKAAREGVTLREAEDDRDLRRWHRLYVETMRRHGVPPRPYAFFEAMWETLAPCGLMRLLLAERRTLGRPVLLAGSIFVMAARTVSYAFNGSRREHAYLRANDLIQWQAIHDACSGGFRRYDMGEVTAQQEGLASFKAKWGATEQRLFRYRYPPRRHASADGTAALAHRVATAAWRGLPKSVAVRLGDWLYRHA
jgi:hypothetical protein